jgi:2-methylisocitrate lyase-like PEP mutase family enzyme
MLGISIPPFDMIWLMETILDHVEDINEKESHEKITNKIKENRLLYELGEITKEEYEKRNRELGNKLQMNNRINRTNLNKRINILG